MFSIKTVFLFIFLQSAAFAQFGFDQEILIVNSFLSFEKVHPKSELKAAIKVDISGEWHINSNKPNEDFLIPTVLEITSDLNIEVGSIQYPSAKNLNFSFSDNPVSVFDGDILIGAKLLIPADAEEGKYNIIFTLNYQACNDVSCLPPNIIKDTLEVEVVNLQTQIVEVNSEIFSQLDLAYYSSDTGGDEKSIAGRLEESGLLLSIILVFIGGLALNLTPCVYPLIPITIGYFGGQSEGSTGKLFLLGILYVLGMALTYSVIGVITALSGAVFGALLQNPLVIIAIAAVFVVLSLSMFGFYEFKLPDSLVMKAGGARSGVFGAFFMGLTLGIVAAPCIGPFVVGLLTYVAAKADVFYGFIMFFFLAVGLGTPYLFLALFSGKIKSLPRAGLWMEGVKHIFGFILLGMALYFLLPLLPKEASSFTLPVFMVITAIYLFFFDKTGNEVKGFKIFKFAFSILLISIASYFLYPGEENSPDWQKYSDRVYDEALENRSKIIIDFYADWCIPCKELDALTFSDERVIAQSKEFVNIKVDMTKTMSDETERIRNKFNIVGMPTVLIIDSNGAEIHRLTGFVNADEFLKLMQSTK